MRKLWHSRKQTNSRTPLTIVAVAKLYTFPEDPSGVSSATGKFLAAKRFVSVDAKLKYLHEFPVKKATKISQTCFLLINTVLTQFMAHQGVYWLALTKIKKDYHFPFQIYQPFLLKTFLETMFIRFSNIYQILYKLNSSFKLFNIVR